MKRVLPLLLFAAWAPAALAFPPCPIEPVDLVPIDGGAGEATASAVSAWYRGHYALVGDPTIIGQIKPDTRATDSGDLPKSGKCRDRDALPVLDGFAGDASVGLSPQYAPRSGFGVIALPDLRIGDGDTRLSYLLSFAIVNTPLAESDDWFDVAQLQFRWTTESTDKGIDPVSSVYRVRLRQFDKHNTVIEVIEASGSGEPDPNTRPRILHRVIATIPVAPNASSTEILLRWNQAKVSTVYGGEIGLPTVPIDQTASVGFDGGPVVPTTDVNSWLEVMDGSHRILARIDLPGQWASELSMGLLNYHVLAPAGYALSDAVVMEKMSLSAGEF